MSAIAVPSREYARRYNGLPGDVDRAFAHFLSRRGSAAVVHELLGVIREHGAEGYLGVLLLHRHFAATRNTLFVEQRFTPPVGGHRITLVTSPTTRGALPSGSVPHRFSVDREGRIHPLEFTSDLLAARAWRRMRRDRRLVVALARLIGKRGYTRVLGLGIYRRQAAVTSATRVYVEETDFAQRVSVVHVLPTLPRVAGRLIPTLWTVRGRGNGCCTQVCVAYCSHPASGDFGIPEVGDPASRSGRPVFAAGKVGYCGHRRSGHIGCA